MSEEKLTAVIYRQCNYVWVCPKCQIENISQDEEERDVCHYCGAEVDLRMES